MASHRFTVKLITRLNCACKCCDCVRELCKHLCLYFTLWAMLLPLFMKTHWRIVMQLRVLENCSVDSTQIKVQWRCFIINVYKRPWMYWKAMHLCQGWTQLKKLLIIFTAHSNATRYFMASKWNLRYMSLWHCVGVQVIQCIMQLFSINFWRIHIRSNSQSMLFWFQLLTCEYFLSYVIIKGDILCYCIF